MKKKRILFITNYPSGTAPGQRFRFEQYFKYLSDNGFECVLSDILTNKEAKLIYMHGYFFRKLYILIKGLVIRTVDIFRLPFYDVVFVFREAFPAGPPWFEKIYSLLCPNMVFDFDDAVWLPNVSDANKKYSWLKFPEKTSDIISYSKIIFAGNQYLADFASKNNKNVVIIPTTIDMAYHHKLNFKNKKNGLCIGWTGSITTIQHFKLSIPVLIKLKEKYKDSIYFKVIGDENYYCEELKLKGTAWNINDEIYELSELDIGIMPLENDDWSKGKCGFKALQYMGLGIPAVISPVGVNEQIITDGVNGFLASTESEWIEKLSRLIDDASLRQKLGEAGKKTILERYSYDSQKDRYVNYLNGLLEGN